MPKYTKLLPPQEYDKLTLEEKAEYILDMGELLKRRTESTAPADPNSPDDQPRANPEPNSADDHSRAPAEPSDQDEQSAPRTEPDDEPKTS